MEGGEPWCSRGAGGVSLSNSPALPLGQDPDTHPASLVFSKLYLRLLVQFGSRVDLVVTQQ